MMQRVALLALLAGGLPAYGGEDTALAISCSAHFEARAQWLEDNDRNDVTVQTLRNRSASLLDIADETMPPSDWRMSTGFSEATTPPSYQDQRDEAVSAALTELVANELYPNELLLCVEDMRCIECTNLWRSYSQ